MRRDERRVRMIGLAAAVVLALSFAACKDSSMIAAPAATSASTQNVAGAWTGSFQSFATPCSGAVATATLQQSGSEVTGLVVAAPCDIRGTFHGTVSGKTLSGRVEMQGCTGGAVLGTASGSELSMSIGDFTRPVVSGDAVVIPGGSVSLHK